MKIFMFNHTNLKMMPHVFKSNFPIYELYNTLGGHPTTPYFITHKSLSNYSLITEVSVISAMINNRAVIEIVRSMHKS
jgi:hypothetical protein